MKLRNIELLLAVNRHRVSNGIVFAFSEIGLDYNSLIKMLENHSDILRFKSIPACVLIPISLCLQEVFTKILCDDSR